jgi:hypothetical protein
MAFHGPVVMRLCHHPILAFVKVASPPVISQVRMGVALQTSAARHHLLVENRGKIVDSSIYHSCAPPRACASDSWFCTLDNWCAHERVLGRGRGGKDVRLSDSDRSHVGKRGGGWGDVRHYSLLYMSVFNH